MGVSLECTRGQDLVHPHEDCCVDALNLDPWFTWTIRGLRSDYTTGVSQWGRLAYARKPLKKIACGEDIISSLRMLDWIGIGANWVKIICKDSYMLNGGVSGVFQPCFGQVWNPASWYTSTVSTQEICRVFKELRPEKKYIILFHPGKKKAWKSTRGGIAQIEIPTVW